MHKLSPHHIDMSKCPVDEYVYIYYPDGTLIVGTSNELEFNYVRSQIAIYNIEGCYVYFRNKKYEITSYGTIPGCPEGLFDSNERIASEILKNGLLKYKDCKKKYEII